MAAVESRGDVIVASTLKYNYRMWLRQFAHFIPRKVGREGDYICMRSRQFDIRAYEYSSPLDQSSVISRAAPFLRSLPRTPTCIQENNKIKEAQRERYQVHYELK